ncbi:MAG: hypothetical protein ACLR56_07655 [Oscillospiraceae bacterium]
MVVYADILIILNFAVDYFLLRAAAFATLIRRFGVYFYPSLRAAFLLYIFLPPRE